MARLPADSPQSGQVWPVRKIQKLGDTGEPQYRGPWKAAVANAVGGSLIAGKISESGFNRQGAYKFSVSSVVQVGYYPVPMRRAFDLNHLRCRVELHCVRQLFGQSGGASLQQQCLCKDPVRINARLLDIDNPKTPTATEIEQYTVKLPA
ncbi:hypothetical protein [Brevundimonas sp.]|uniref:hypothetical protein n=1 Tax=Brevundimonas sp. TaxID=1871086 RepID=UPI0035B20E1A